MRVLVVDDSRTMRRIICSALGELHDEALEVLEAGDGVEALQLLRNEKLEIDLVLIDWNMPRLDGIGFLKQLRAISPFRDVHVIMVTSQANRANVAEALRWGACDYVVKPFTPDVLQEKIRKVASKVETRRCEDTSVLLRTMAEGGAGEADCPFLDQLPTDLMEQVRLIGCIAGFQERAVIVPAGARMNLLSFVLQGAVEVGAPAPSTSEIRRPGDCFAEQSFFTGEPVAGPVVARTSVRTLSLSRIQVADLARRRHEFSFALSRWITRPTRLQRSAPAVPAGLAGRLETMPFADLVQVLQICKKTGVLRLSRGSGSASLFFDDGELRHVKEGDRAGDEAFYRLMGWTDAGFSFESGTRTDIVNVTLSTMMLLMEGSRRLDEARNPRDGSSVPAR
jgi:two-component system chemotaxis response regulator CheY